MKYKVGDKVRIVSKWREGCYPHPQGGMDKWLGKVMTIKEVSNRFYKMEEDGGHWFWWELSIEGLAETVNKKIVITTDGEETLARLYDGNKVVKTATAKCSPADTFDFKNGAELAFNRLFEKEKKPEKQKYYNGKVVCVEKRYKHSIPIPYFTVGKVYKVKDGIITGDNGWESFKYSNLEILCLAVGNTFIPLVE